MLLYHKDVSLSLPLSLPVSLKAMKKKMFLGEDKKKRKLRDRMDILLDGALEQKSGIRQKQRKSE